MQMGSVAGESPSLCAAARTPSACALTARARRSPVPPPSCPSRHQPAQPPFVLTANFQFKPGEVDVAAIQAKVFGAALARWQMGVIKAPSNRGLKPSKFQFYDRWHYYQARQRMA